MCMIIDIRTGLTLDPAVIPSNYIPYIPPAAEPKPKRPKRSGKYADAPMRFYSRSRQFRASNVYFDIDACEAYSYGWWRFVEVIGGKVVFNSCGYSMSTCGHQAKVRRLLRYLDVRIDCEIKAPGGLQNLETAISRYEYEISKLEREIAKPRTHATKNAKRRAEITAHQESIKLVKRLIKAKEKSA
jgi:hypothetical protein